VRIESCTAGLLLACLASTASAQVPGWNTKQFSLDRIDANLVVLIGEVELVGEEGSANAGQKFFADRAEINLGTGELVASGNVVFSTPTERISGDTMAFNTRTKLGSFSHASGIASLGERGEKDRAMFGTLEPDVYFYGETIEKIGPDKYRIVKGAFTTCVQPTPRWEIVGTSATINLHDYAMLRNAVIRVKDVPVFYLPIIYYPIQDDDRATGFLIPTYGKSTYRGSSISNAFFWAMNRSQDATFFHDWFLSRGQGAGTEYRYIASPASQGNARAYWLNENESTIDTPSGPSTQPARRSFRISGGLTQGLPAGLRGSARMEYFSDVTAEQLYNNNIYQATLSTRSIGGGVSGAWKGLSLSGNYQRTESFYSSENSYVSGNAPGLVMSYSGQRIANLPLYASTNLDAAHVLYVQRGGGGHEIDSSLSKVDILPSLRAPLSTLPYLTFNASAGYRVTYFTESLNERGLQVEDPLTRTYADLRAEVVGPVFTRVFTPGNAFADRLKHVVEPTFTLQRITTIDDQARVPTTASYEYVIGGTTRLTYGFTNRLLVRRAAAAGTAAAATAAREFLSVALNQSYYSNEAANQYDNSYGYGYGLRPPSSFSPIALVARSMPAQMVGVDFRLEYDPLAEAQKLSGFGLNGSLRATAIQTTAGWTRNRYGTGASTVTSSDYIQQSTSFQLRRNSIGATVEFNYDIGRSTLIQHRYIGYYNAQCCGLLFEYQAYNYPQTSSFPVPKDRRFNFSFTLAGVGSFANLMGAFGGNTY
jgi:LPS-assembly protein